MPGLMDIAKSRKTVVVGETKVEVVGLSADAIAYLFERFPVIRELITGRAIDLAPADLVKLVPDAVSAIIACGCGYVGDSEAEDVARTIGLESQVDLIEAVMKLTAPGGVGPFVERLVRFAENVGVQPMSIQDGKLPSESNDS